MSHNISLLEIHTRDAYLLLNRMIESEGFNVVFPDLTFFKKLYCVVWEDSFGFHLKLEYIDSDLLDKNITVYEDIESFMKCVRKNKKEQ